MFLLSAPRAFSMHQSGGSPPWGAVSGHSSELGEVPDCGVLYGLTFLESNNLQYRLLTTVI